MLKSYKSKMATLTHDVCDVHGGCIQVFPYWGNGGNTHPPPTPSPHTSQKLALFLLSTKFLLPLQQKSIQPDKKIKTSFSAVFIAPLPFLF